MQYFDYENVARRAGISQEQLDELCKLVRQEFPRDDMMYELHLLRICLSIQSGHINLNQVLHSKRAA